MTSSINTGSINVNYPVPGVNNSSQGFRDNFAGIKNNLDTAGTEISALQGASVLKTAIDGVPLNNDMANTLISNALVQGFRATTYNLGNNLSGTVTVDVSRADVHYGTITGNVGLQFSKWAPVGTQSNVQLILNVANSNAQITFPTTVNDGTTTLENYVGNGTGGRVTIPAGVTRLHYNFTTIDCGTTVEVQPLDRPRSGGGGGGSSIANGSASLTAIASNVSVAATGNLIPTANVVYDLGTPTRRWRDLYLSGNTIYVGDQQITIQGTYTEIGNLITGNIQTTGVIVTDSFSAQTIDTGEITVLGVSTLGNVTNVKIGGGLPGQVLSTDGGGNLSWINAGGGGGANVVSIPPIYFTSTAAGNNLQFVDSRLSTYTSNTQITLFRNGALLENGFYTISGNTLTINTPLNVGDSIDIIGTTAANLIGPVPEGSNTEIQFNNDGSLGASANLTYNTDTNTLTTVNATLSGLFKVAPRTPTSISTGNVGEICWDDNYVYVCVATNSWKRSPLYPF